MTPVLKIARLEVLADHMATAVKPKKLGMADWCYNERFDNPNPKIGDCGTSACVLGHAGFIPAFRRAGLKSTFDTSKSDVVYTARDGRVFSFENAGQEFFGLTPEQGIFLFMPTSYTNEYGVFVAPTPKQVARRIRRLIKNPTNLSKQVI